MAITLGAGVLPAKAGSRTWEFTTDPTTDANPIQVYQSGFQDSSGNSVYWKGSGGNPGGFLAITWPLGSSTTIARFPDIDNGLLVTGFTLECDLRIGNPQQNVRAADGFSVNFARATDPAVMNDPPTASDFATPGAVETGTTTGLAVCFDTWSGNALPDGGDIEGIIVRVDNRTVLREPLPTRNGACEDNTSLQTGPRDEPYWINARNNNQMPDAAFEPGSWAGLCWQRLRVELLPNGQLTVVWKGRTVLDRFATGFFPSPGRIILAGRTGGADEHAHFDNLKLETVATVDNNPPTAPSNLAANALSPRQVQLTWNAATDDSGVVAYEVEENGTILPGFVTTTTFTKSAAPNTSYNYRVRATDPAGNKSAFIGPVSVTTPALTILPKFPCFVKVELFTGITGVSLDDLTSNDKYISNTPDEVRFVPIAEFPDGTPTVPPAGNVFDNYGWRLSGYFLPWQTGPYKFFLATDDGGGLWLSTDDKPENKKMIAQEPTWNPVRAWVATDRRPGCPGTCENRSDQFSGTEWPAGNTINLEAGKAYYFEALAKEGGGGDNLAVLAVPAGDPDPANGAAPLNGGVIAGDIEPAPGATVTITQNPVATSAAAGAKATFTADATGSPAPICFQWYKIPTGGTEQLIFGATGKTLTTDFLTPADNNAEYFVRAVVLGDRKDSARAKLTVTEPQAPKILRASGSDTFDRVTVEWDQPMDATTAGTAGNYQIAGLTISGATVLDRTRVRLTTSRQAENTEYTVVATGVRSSLGLTATPPGNSAKFRSFLLQTGVMKYERWNGVSGGLDGLKSDPRYPDNPDIAFLVPAYEAPSNVADNYGARVRGFFIPPTTGDYVGFCASDDPGELSLSTDDNPANLKVVATEPQWNGIRAWKSTDRRPGCEAGQCEHRTDQYAGTEWPTGNTISLTAGRRYYTQFIFVEGGGGDNGAALFVPAARADAVASGDPANHGAEIAWYLDPEDGPPVITQPPVGQAVDVGGTATFRVGGVLGRKPLSYQWLSFVRNINGDPIPGATSDTLTINNAGPLDVGFYGVRVSNELGSADSSRASLFLNGTLFIEAEDFNFDQGQWDKTNPIGMSGPYPGGTYQDKGSESDRGIDWAESGGNAGQPYRPGTGVAAGKRNQHDEGLPRGAFSVQVNHVVGWNDDGDWYNYTRVFPTPAKNYNVVARMSSGGAAINGRLDRVTGATTADQTLELLGQLDSPASGNWDVMIYVPLRDGQGNLASVSLGGETTLRFTTEPGNLDIDYMMFIPATTAVAPTIRVGRVAGSGDIELVFTGNLYRAEKVTGPYNPVPGATSPRRVTPTPGGESYWRAGP